MRRAWAMALLALWGCGSGEAPGAPPGDGDGDGDYLSDAEEAELGTDPNNPDSDGDSYLDGDEVLEGTDPLDAASVIYQGGWPYQRNKDSIVDPGFTGQVAAGALLPRLVSYDQYGELVDIYDFALHGKPVVIDLSAGWCEACKDMATWLEGGSSMLPAEYGAIPAMVNQGDIHWITVVFEDASATAATAAYAALWAAEFPNPHIAVIADDDRALYDWLFPGSYPFLIVMDDDMTLRSYDRFDYRPALDSLLE